MPPLPDGEVPAKVRAVRNRASPSIIPLHSGSPIKPPRLSALSPSAREYPATKRPTASSKRYNLIESPT